MARLLALEWDSREARIVVGSGRSGGVNVDKALAVPLCANGESAVPTSEEIGKRIAAALAEHRLGHPQTLVAVSRSRVELKHLTLPPAPDDESPDLVRFQAMKDFHALGDSWKLDYVPQAGSDTTSREVLAAALSPQLETEINTVCRAAGLEIARVTLASCGAASLLSRHEPSEDGARLFVELTHEEADMTVLIGSKIVLLRSMRLSHDVLAEPEQAQALIGELRRTLVAVRHAVGDRKIEWIYLFGGRPEHAIIAKQIQAAIECPVRLFDPFDKVNAAPSAVVGDLAHVGEFASLLGMLTDETADVAPSLDFWNPRRRPPPVSNRGPAIRYGVLVGTIVLLLVGWLWYALDDLDAQIAQLEADAAGLNQTVKKAEDKLALANQVTGWTNREIQWLDELRDLSVKFPPAKSAMLTSLKAGRTADGGGEIKFEGRADDTATVGNIEAQLRFDEFHRVVGRGSAENTAISPYSWAFSSTMLVSPTSVQQQQTPDKAVPAESVAQETTAKSAAAPSNSAADRKSESARPSGATSLTADARTKSPE